MADTSGWYEHTDGLINASVSWRSCDLSAVEMALLDRCTALDAALVARAVLEARAGRADAEPEGWHRAARPRRDPSEPGTVTDIALCAQSVYRINALVSGLPSGRCTYDGGTGQGVVSGWARSRGGGMAGRQMTTHLIISDSLGNASRRPRPAQSGRSCRRPLPLAPPAPLQRPSQHPNCTSRYTLVLQPTRTPSGTHTARYRLENPRAGKSYMEAIHLRI